MEQIQTFDLIGFKGDGVISKVLGHFQTKALRKSYQVVDVQITHVGIAIRGDDILQLPEQDISILKNRIDANIVYLFESNRVPRTMDKVPDVFGCYPMGVKLRSLNEVASNFRGDVYYSPHLFQTNKEMVKEFVNFIIQNNHVPYEKSPIVLLANVFRCFRSKIETDSVFCSELVAKVLIQLSVLDKSVNAEYVMPLDFYINPHNPTVTFDIDGEIPILFKLPIKIN